MKNEQKPTAKVRRQKTLDPEAWYSLNDIVQLGLFPWVKEFRAVRNVVLKDRASRNLLKTVITGEGHGTKYRFKGKNIANFIHEFEAGKAKI